MRKRSLWRTSTFRLTFAFGGLFLLAVGLLLGLVYAQTFGVLSRRVDLALADEARIVARELAHSPAVAVGHGVGDARATDPVTAFALYAQDGGRIVGDGWVRPSEIVLDGAPHVLASHVGRAPQRALGQRLADGTVLVVQRDIGQLVAFRRIVVSALLWSGGLILGLGLALGVLLSLAPLRRVQAMRAASDRIAQGDLSARLPAAQAGDELDELARIVNRMVEEVERLVAQAQNVGESVAHELRTPLTRLRATLDHLARGVDLPEAAAQLVETCVMEADGVLARFRALLRVASVEQRRRYSGVGPVSPAAIVEQATELYAPLAAELGVALDVEVARCGDVAADGELLFEALSNLVDNALKFTPRGGKVSIRLFREGASTVLEVRDDGVGIPAAERALVTRRFYRSPSNADDRAGHGLGLSLVAAVAALHGFALTIDDASPGTVVRLRIA